MVDFLIFVLVSILIIEIVFRVFLFAEIMFDKNFGLETLLRENISNSKGKYFQSHPYTIFVKTQNAEGLYPSNNFGYVGRKKIAKEKNENTTRLYFVGGSTIQTFDEKKGPDSHWPGQIEKKLNSQIQNNKKIEVINAGFSGYTSIESMVEFQLRGLEFNPDILFIYHNINDVRQAQMVDSFKSDYSHSRKSAIIKKNILDNFPKQNFLISLHIILRVIIKLTGKKNNLISQISYLPFLSDEPFDKQRVKAYSRNIFNLISVALANDIIPIVMEWEYDKEKNIEMSYFHKKYSQNFLRGKCLMYINENNKAIKELCEKNNVIYFKLQDLKSSHFDTDGVHFSNKGLEKVSNDVSQKLKFILSKNFDIDF